MDDAAFEVMQPRRRETCAIFASPHSGRDYPRDLIAASVLDSLAIRSSEDAFVDELFSAATVHGAPFLVARVPRAYVDFNRSASELDPALIRGVRPQPFNPRVSSGLGVIPRVVAGGRAIYAGKLPLGEAEDRIRRCWVPYHACVEALIRDSLARFGRAILIDCHSMPREALEGAGPGRPRPEVVLGDRFGLAASAAVSATVEAAFAAEGFRVARNAPFAGAYVAERYGRPARGVHVVQVEIDRSLYLDERRVVRRPGFAGVKARIARVVAAVCAYGRDAGRLAAE